LRKLALQPKLMRKIVVVGAITMLFAYAVVAYHLHTQMLEGYSDFISFYTAGKIVGSGQGHRLYDLGLQYQIQRQYAPRVKIRAGALPFVRPPFEAWLFAPLAALPYTTAFGVWNGVTLIIVVVIAVLLQRYVYGLQQVPLVLVLLLLLSYFPVFLTLLQGQDSVLLLLIFLLVYLSLQKERELSGGMLLGLGLFKFPLVLVFLVPFVVARRCRLFAGFCITLLVVTAVSVGTTGWRACADYPRYLIGVNRLAAGINDPRDMPNIRGLLTAALSAVLSPFTINIIVAAISLALIVWLATNYRLFIPKGSQLFSLAFSLDLLIMLLAGYHAHVFDLVLLVPSIAIAAGTCLLEESLRPSTRKALTLVTACLMFSPLYFIVSLTFRYATVLAVFVFAAAIAVSKAMQDAESWANIKKQGNPAHG
jgi:hypothetical protein